MADYKTAVRAIAMADASLVTLIDARYYVTGKVPSGTAKPYVTAHKVSSEHPQHLATGPTDAAEARLQINVVGQSDDAVEQVADCLRLALDGYQGTSDTVEIRSMWLEGSSDVYQVPEDGSQRGTHMQALDFALIYRVSTS